MPDAAFAPVRDCFDLSRSFFVADPEDGTVDGVSLIKNDGA
jgi:hypothetical protein